MPEQMWVQAGAQLLADIDRTKVPEKSVAVWFLGQMGFVIKGADTVAYLDPYLVEAWKEDALGNRVSRRRFPPPFSGEQICHADVVLGTHNHSDHINVPTVTGIAGGSPKSRFVVPAPHIGVLTQAGISSDRVLGAKVGVEISLGQLTITPIPAAHEELEQDVAGNYVSLGYVLRLNGVTLFHAGDTVDYPGFVEQVKKHHPDIVMLPINGRDMLRTNRGIIGNINFREAADIGYAMGAKLVMPGHFDVFPQNSENPAFFADYMYRFYPAQPYKIMVPGERIVYMV